MSSDRGVKLGSCDFKTTGDPCASTSKSCQSAESSRSTMFALCDCSCKRFTTRTTPMTRTTTNATIRPYRMAEDEEFFLSDVSAVAGGIMIGLAPPPEAMLGGLARASACFFNCCSNVKGISFGFYSKKTYFSQLFYLDILNLS